MTRSVSSAFFTKMQGDSFGMALVIDLETPGQSFHWTGANDKLTYTLSSVPTEYNPFPGTTGRGIRESNDLSVSVIDFIVANTGDLFPDLMANNDLDFAEIKIGRVFTDTPDLGRMEIYQGRLGEYSYDRNAISGQARNKWNSGNVRWPHYNFQDKCAWTFGSSGCGFDTSSITETFSAGNIVAGSTTTLAIRFTDGTITNTFANNRFDFGRLTVTNGPNSGSIRTIRVHTGDLFQLSHALPVNSFATFDISVFPGCRKQRIADCTTLYDNPENFLGFPWIPIQEDAF
jgi:hypothetical protein